MTLIISSLSPSDTLIHLTTDFVIMGTPMRGRLACVGAVLLVATATGVAPGLMARAMAPAPVVWMLSLSRWRSYASRAQNLVWCVRRRSACGG